MISFLHEKFNLNGNASRSEPRAFTGHGTANPGSTHGNKDRGALAGTGGPASGMDSRRVGDNAPEFESLDAPGKRSRGKSAGTCEATRASATFDAEGAKTVRRRPGEVSCGIRAPARPMGRSHARGPSEASVRDNLEGSSGSVLDAPVRVSTEAGRVYVSSGKERRCQTLSSGLKKNSDIWDRRKPSFLKTKRGLPCTLVWG